MAERETPNDILDATKRALCDHGYADLTMQRIADEAGMTTAAIHYHFDTKQELLNAFLDDLIHRFQERLVSDTDDPRERLAAYLDVIFESAEEDHGAFPVALMELKSQAPFHEEYRERFRELDARMQGTIEDAARDGIEAGHFEEADPETIARFVVTMINGAHSREVALGERPLETRSLIEAYLHQQLGWPAEATE